MFGCELDTPDAGGIDGMEPLGMTAKNGAPGGSFCVGGSGGRNEGKTRHSGLLWAFGVCWAAAGGIILLTSAIWWVYGAAGGACVALTAERVPLMGDEVVG